MKLDRDKLYPWLALLRAKFMGSSRAMKLQQIFGSIEKALHASPEKISSLPGFSLEMGKSIREAARGKFDKDIEQELRWVEKDGISIILHSDPAYPPPLRHIPAPPALLYIKGTLKLSDILAVAIVGSRRSSDGGKRLTNKIARDLADAGLTIVSGLAWGIDASAHKGALKSKTGRTIAVLGNGLKYVYPREHKLLADQIVKRGALITELFYDVAPQGQNFPPRNRIISGLSLGVLIAEAPRRSGALITADYALEQGKEIFALPGNVEHGISPGTNKLIQDSSATLVTSAHDILKELDDKITFYRNELEGKIPRVDLAFEQKRGLEKNAGNCDSQPDSMLFDRKHDRADDSSPPDVPPQPSAQREISSPDIQKPVPLSEDEKTVLKSLSDESQHIDLISRQLQWPVARVSSALGLLELKGIIERESGMKFRLMDI